MREVKEKAQNQLTKRWHILNIENILLFLFPLKTLLIAKKIFFNADIHMYSDQKKQNFGSQKSMNDLESHRKLKSDISKQRSHPVSPTEPEEKIHLPATCTSEDEAENKK